VAKAEPYLTHLVRLMDNSSTFHFVYPASCLCTNLYQVPALTVEKNIYRCNCVERCLYTWLSFWLLLGVICRNHKIDKVRQLFTYS
jgi:hypothetical protein